MDGWIGELMDGWMYTIDRWMYRWTDVQMDGCIDGLMYRWIDV